MRATRWLGHTNPWKRIAAELVVLALGVVLLTCALALLQIAFYGHVKW